MIVFEHFWTPHWWYSETDNLAPPSTYAMVHIIYFCMQLIGILAPTQNSEAMGPGSHNLKWKINFFSRFFKNELLLSQNHFIFHCDFFRALFVDLISFRDLFPPGVHYAMCIEIVSLYCKKVLPQCNLLCNLSQYLIWRQHLC